MGILGDMIECLAVVCVGGVRCTLIEPLGLEPIEARGVLGEIAPETENFRKASSRVLS